MSSEFQNSYENTDHAVDSSTRDETAGLDAAALWQEMERLSRTQGSTASGERSTGDMQILSMASPYESSTPAQSERPDPERPDEKRPDTSSEQDRKNENRDSLPSGDRPESEESRRERLERERFFGAGQMAGIILSIAHRGDEHGITTETLESLQRRLDSMGNDSQIESYLAGLNHILAGGNRQIRYVSGTDASGQPTRTLQVFDSTGNPVPVKSRWEGHRRY